MARLNLLPSNKVKAQRLPPDVVPWPSAHEGVLGRIEGPELSGWRNCSRHFARARECRRSLVDNIIATNSIKGWQGGGVEPVEHKGIENLENDIHFPMSSAMAIASLGREDGRLDIKIED